ncbi:MAG: AI-2E family transporter [Oscillospiraceae bacterium]|nr:AI-2E family transporter [Oscillospiraceae bacterium]
MHETDEKDPQRRDDWHRRAVNALWTFLTVAAAILFYYLVQYLGTISKFIGTVLTGLSPVIWGLIFAYLLMPVAVFYEKHLLELFLPKTRDRRRTEKRCRAAAAILMLLSAVAFIAILLWLIIPQISSSITGVIKNLPEQMATLAEEVEGKVYFDEHTAFGASANAAIRSAMDKALEWVYNDLPAMLTDMTSQSGALFGYVFTGVKNAFSVVYNLVIGLILSVYITIDRDRMQLQVKQMTYSILPTQTASHLRRRFAQANKKFSSAIRGKIVDSMIIGLICFVVLLILNLLPWFSFPYPVLLAVIVGVTNVVPFFGPFVGGFITAVLVLFNDPHMVIPYLILIVALQQFDCNYLDPHIVGGSIGLRPFWSIFACLLGSSVLGVPGFVLGPPIFAFAYEFITDWSEDRLRAKHLDDRFDIPPEEAFEDFTETAEDFTGSLLQEDSPATPEPPADPPLAARLLESGRERFQNLLQKRKK